jgi:rod shape-determining protein MreC
VPSNLSSKTNRERAVWVAVPLLLLQLALLSVQIQNPTGMAPLKTLLLAVQAPIVGVTSDIAGGIRGTWENYIWLVGARKENEKLRENVRQLTILNRSYDQIQQENARLQQLLSMKDIYRNQSVGARVIARTPGFLSNVLYIDRGSKDGVDVDCPVISGDGIIGRIMLVSKNQSQVQLITNPDASIGAMMEQSRSAGVLRGSGDLLLDLNYISNAEQVNVGDLVLSSGLDEIYPKGFTIGKVVEVRKDRGASYTIKVEPVMDLYHIEEVSVLLMKP